VSAQKNNAKSTWQRIARRIRVPMGFLFSGFFIYFAHPSWNSLGWSLLLVVPGLWLRAYAAGYVKKNAELTMSGPYAYTRNPLYLGSMAIAFGFAAAARNLWILLVLAALFLIIYLPVIRAEEEFLRAKFAGFDAYAARVPRLLPRLVPAGSSHGDGRFSSASWRRHREYNSLVGSSVLYAALLVKLNAAQILKLFHFSGAH
jgi:protein-S-isoprenylcysteine O-methyltransferase Ste14